jgi:hypothetical protein
MEIKRGQGDLADYGFAPKKRIWCDTPSRSILWIRAGLRTHRVRGKNHTVTIRLPTDYAVAVRT